MFNNKKNILITSVFLLIVVISGLSIKFSLYPSSKEKVPNAKVPQESIQQEVVLEDSLDIVNSQELEEPKAADKKPEIIKYTVKVGDTAEAIANSYGVKVSTIIESNSISKDTIIKEGQELKFPSVDGVLYKIKNGETLWDISSLNDIDVNNIVTANSMDSPDKLQIGQEIIIPGVERLKVASVTKPKSVKDSKTNSKTSNIKVASRGTSSSASISALQGMIWPVRGKITSGFGQRWGELHPGLDIAAPVGTNIKAALDGKVIFNGWENGYGNIVKLSHGGGIVTYYGHNSKNLVKVGDNVAKGEVIAKLGNTGRSTGPHVEFGIKKNGVPVNPSLYLK